MKPPAFQSIQEVSKNSWHVVHRVCNPQGERFLLKSPRPGNLEDLASQKLQREYKHLKDAEITGVPIYLELLDLRG